MAGSNVKGRDFVKASLELANIYWTYLRPGAPQLADVADAADGLAKPVLPPTRGDQRAA